MIWSKSFVMVRERNDGADIAHLLYQDARLPPFGGMTREQMAQWTAAIGNER